MNYRAVLFDFDGVIAHTIGIVKHSLLKLFREKNLHIEESDFESGNWGTKSLVQLSTILKEKYNINLDAPALHTHIWETQKSLFQEGLESDPSLIPFLEFCKNTGIKIAIGSNSSTKRIEWVLELMKIEEYFLYEQGNKEKGYNIIGANMLTYHKPDPEVWIRCAQMLEVPISECLVIEDGLPGLTGAKTCGARGIYYHRFCRVEKACGEIAERSIESFSELLENNFL